MYIYAKAGEKCVTLTRSLLILLFHCQSLIYCAALLSVQKIGPEKWFTNSGNSHQLLDPSHTFLCGTTTLTRQFPILEDGELIKRSRFLCSLNPFHWYRHFSRVQRHIQRRKCWYEEGKRAALTGVETGHVQHRAMWDTVEDFVMSESLTWTKVTMVCYVSTKSNLFLAEEEEGRRKKMLVKASFEQTRGSWSPKQWFLTMSWISTHVCLIMNMVFIPKTGRFCSTYEVEAAMHSHHSLHSFQEAPE